MHFFSIILHYLVAFGLTIVCFLLIEWRAKNKKSVRPLTFSVFFIGQLVLLPFIPQFVGLKNDSQVLSFYEGMLNYQIIAAFFWILLVLSLDFLYFGYKKNR